MPLAPPSTARRHHARSASPRTGLAATALVFGVLGGGLALTVAFAGLYVPVSWYAVVPLAIVGLACGLLSVGRRRTRSAAVAGMAWIGTMGGIVALVLGVWGVTNAIRGPHTTAQQVAAGTQPVLHSSAAPVAPPTTSVIDGPQIAFGQVYQLDGVQVRLSGPNPYTPSPLASATDGAITRAAKFTVTVVNGTNRPLNAAGVNVVGFVDGMQIGRVYDQDIPTLANDVRPGQTVSFPVAFNLPTAGATLVVQVDPQAMTSTDKVYVVGRV